MVAKNVVQVEIFGHSYTIRGEANQEYILEVAAFVDRKLQGQDVTALMQEIGTLRREQREWQGERRDVASRIETMLKKLEKLEA